MATIRKEQILVIHWFVVVTTFLGIMTVYSQFLGWNEARPGTVLNDPILTLFQPIDLSVFLFACIYGGIVLFLVLSRRQLQQTLFLGLASYSLLLLLRMVCMWVTPLGPPPTMIVLVDPLATLFAAGEPMRQDLFFSGHTATMTLLTLLAQPKYRPVFVVGVVGIAVGVLLQHVHYTVDVVVAICAAYCSYRVVVVLWSRMQKSSVLAEN